VRVCRGAGGAGVQVGVGVQGVSGGWAAGEVWRGSAAAVWGPWLEARCMVVATVAAVCRVGCGQTVAVLPG
jgi:hypothetical protein